MCLPYTLERLGHVRQLISKHRRIAAADGVDELSAFLKEPSQKETVSLWNARRTVVYVSTVLGYQVRDSVADEFSYFIGLKRLASFVASLDRQHSALKVPQMNARKLAHFRLTVESFSSNGGINHVLRNV